MGFPDRATQGAHGPGIPGSGGEIAWLIDSTPVLCGKFRKTVKCFDLAGHVNDGYCASRFRYFWGFRLCLICTPDGMPIVWG